MSGTSYRPSEDLAWLLLPAVVALAVAAGRLTLGARLVGAGAVLLWIGAALLAAGIVVNAVLPGDSPLWWLHDTDTLGRLVPVVGFLLAGVGVVGSRFPAGWAGGAVVVAALVAVPFNAQDERALVSVPLGLAWVALGLAWASEERARPELGVS